ncbi:hypothetical protein FKZ61_016615 [Litorilinea aerophila]|uniref:P-II family nitrogen regulator n=1 Tax=Litorilinea aerophila TaxID=1204385 RepID=A0A540VCL7_9CHLR|nr:hypothetical protein [Litorilinea aerophila]MCC9077724.1 hypothetical protein [Litorilinea aerophila]GIV76993.1 MAG: hypothetical protein KatS3mg050_1387 [Litorilinea sp.]
MVMCVLDDPDQLDPVLDAWHALGVGGVTIVESSGLHRRRVQVLGARYTFGFPVLAERIQQGHYTLFTVVPDLETVRHCLRAVEQIVGDLEAPNTGILAAWELSLFKGTVHPDSTPEADA